LPDGVFGIVPGPSTTILWGPNVDRRDHRPSDVVRLVSEGLANNDIATRQAQL
jgi:DNA-binding NarL/FixJ family response regulator